MPAAPVTVPSQLTGQTLTQVPRTFPFCPWVGLGPGLGQWSLERGHVVTMNTGAEEEGGNSLGWEKKGEDNSPLVQWFR